MHLLQKFVEYFHAEVPDLIKKVQENKVHIASQCGSDFYRPSVMDDEIDNENKIYKFISAISKNDDDLKLCKMLSKRELECIEWMLKGRTSSQIAEELNLSKRTVEHYFENIKNKLGCNTKSEIFDKALLLKELGIM